MAGTDGQIAVSLNAPPPNLRRKRRRVQWTGKHGGSSGSWGDDGMYQDWYRHGEIDICKTEGINRITGRSHLMSVRDKKIPRFKYRRWNWYGIILSNEWNQRPKLHRYVKFLHSCCKFILNYYQVLWSRVNIGENAIWEKSCQKWLLDHNSIIAEINCHTANSTHIWLQNDVTGH